MSDTQASLRAKLGTAADLLSVVRTMKAIAGSRIVQYDNSVRALADYYRTVELALGAYFRAHAQPGDNAFPTPRAGVTCAVVFGSDQGLVGQFNQQLAEYAQQALADMPGRLEVWAVGERMLSCLATEPLPLMGVFPVPNSVQGIVPLVGRILVECGVRRATLEYEHFYVFHNQPQSAGQSQPRCRRLLPLDAEWQKGLVSQPWPDGAWPEVLPAGSETLGALIDEYLFIAIFRACAESLASENASRLEAMQRAEHNIDDLLEELRSTFNRLRQDGIDEELFDVVAGYEALGATAARASNKGVAGA